MMDKKWVACDRSAFPVSEGRGASARRSRVRRYMRRMYPEMTWTVLRRADSIETNPARHHQRSGCPPQLFDVVTEKGTGLFALVNNAGNLQPGPRDGGCPWRVSRSSTLA
jgi:hypothetical protein